MDNPTDEQRQQLDQRDHLTRMCMFSVDQFVMNNRAELQHVTGADQSRLIVEAAIGSLLDNGQIAIVEDAPESVRVDLPPHLVPDVDEAVARLRRFDTGSTTPT